MEKGQLEQTLPCQPGVGPKTHQRQQYDVYNQNGGQLSQYIRSWQPIDPKETFPIHRHEMHRDLSTVDWSQCYGGNRSANVEHLHVMKRNGECGQFRGPEIQNVHLSSESFPSDN
ncbi:hypothetical protein T4A_3195 [Trichinella pseudospiralis]|uniref:Uncharacterized protein n=1 Tax=Trichinella pseudospiralis TaxID=6337 RepID=A0A0V1E0R7_TRIPS|nr:hypothetical protein T4A_3195 [Trichinella pseudospiralis]